MNSFSRVVSRQFASCTTLLRSTPHRIANSLRRRCRVSHKQSSFAVSLLTGIKKLSEFRSNCSVPCNRKFAEPRYLDSAKQSLVSCHFPRGVELLRVADSFAVLPLIIKSVPDIDSVAFLSLPSLPSMRANNSCVARTLISRTGRATAVIGGSLT